MRNLLSLLAAGALVAAGGSAYAVTADFTVTLELELSGFDPILFSGEGTGETIPGGSVTLPEGSIVAGFARRLEEPLLSIFEGVAVCEQGQPPSSVFPIPATPGFEVLDCDPLANGKLGELVYDGVSEAVGATLATAYLTNAANVSLASIPLDLIGVGGEVDFPLVISQATLAANPWTTGTVSVKGGLASGAPEEIQADAECTGTGVPLACCTAAGQSRCSTLGGTGSDDRNAAGFGELRLVTTALVDLGSSFGTVPTIGRLEITFPAPEPGAGAVGVAAAGALALLARRRAVRSWETHP